MQIKMIFIMKLNLWLM